MALLNVSRVTTALTNLLRLSVTASPEWSAADTLEVSPLPPDKLKQEREIGFYLYHITEDPQYKNLPAPGDSNAPVRFSPMGLHLNYILTARWLSGGEEDPLMAQKLMGLAMKAFHDVPLVDDTTQINGSSVFPDDLKGSGNRLRVVLQPTPPSDAVHYWTAGSQPLRLASYYQVSVVLLEPEPETLRSGRVLNYGVHTFLQGAPRLHTSSNRITFTVPGETEVRILECRPAEVPVGGQVAFIGVNLAGTDTSLWLRDPGWGQAEKADPLQWSVSAAPERVLATVQDHIDSKAILPGIYTARVEVTTERTMPDGSVGQFRTSSNETPFAVAPSIKNISFLAREATVTGGSFDPAALPGDAIQVFVGVGRLDRVEAATVPPGAFRVVSPTVLCVHLPTEAKSGEAVPFRVLVRGVESAPAWIIIP
jgi:hypothetical protein